MTRTIKKALAKKYGYKNVSVKGDTGTAYGWIHIKVLIDDIHEETHRIHPIYNTCIDCREIEKEMEKEVLEISRKALAEAGKEFYSYTDDMNYEHEEVFVNFGVKK